MTPADMDHSSTVVRSREQVIADRHRRQTRTFMTVLGASALVGLVAFGGWQGWWSFGGSAEAATICPVAQVTAPELTDVNVINSTDKAGLAAAVAKELQKRKFTVLSIESEEKALAAVVQVRYGTGGEQAARTVALQFPGKTKLVKIDRDDESVDLIIGTKYKNMVSAKKGAAAIVPPDKPHGCVVAPTATPTPEATETESDDG